MRAMYSGVHNTQNKFLILKSYITGINTSIFPKTHYENISSGKIINELHSWIENHLRLIHFPNVEDSFFVKTNGTLVKKHNHILQISVRYQHKDMVLPISEGVFFGARTSGGKVYIGDTSLRKFMPKCIKPMRNRNNITSG